MLSIHLDMEFFPDRVRITNRQTKQTIDRSAPHPFSSEHRLLSEKAVAFDFLKALIIEIDRRRFRLLANADAIIAEGPNSAADRDELRQLLIELGCSKVSILG
jgi:hypothetical protein